RETSQKKKNQHHPNLTAFRRNLEPRNTHLKKLEQFSPQLRNNKTMASQSNPASIAPALAPATSKPKETSTATPPKATSQMGSPPKKRTGAATESSAAPKVTKRRAARACVSCRARKVRCDVVEGAPCGNCRWDNVECVVQESRRRK